MALNTRLRFQLERGWLLGLMALLLAACASARPAATPTVISSTPLPIASASQPAAACPSEPAPSFETSDFFPSRALPEVVSASTAIVVGRAEPSNEIVNMARGDVFAIGQVYTVTVQRYLKGSGPGTLKVIQAEGDIFKPVACITAQDITLAKTLYAKDYIPMQSDTDYLLLLTHPPLPGLATDYWFGVDRRWRWRLQPDGIGLLEVVGYTIQTEPTPTWSESQPIVPQIEALINSTHP